MNRNSSFVVAAIACAILATSCDNNDERLARFARESARQQAEQNREMAQLNREVSQAHTELVSLHHDLEEQQAVVHRQRDQLESERREIAQQRHRDPIIATAISNVGLVLACLVPLALAGYLLCGLRDRSEDQAVGELLIQELTTDRPLVLPSPRMGLAAIEGRREPKPPSLTQADVDHVEDSTG